MTGLTGPGGVNTADDGTINGEKSYQADDLSLAARKWRNQLRISRRLAEDSEVDVSEDEDEREERQPMTPPPQEFSMEELEARFNELSPSKKALINQFAVPLAKKKASELLLDPQSDGLLSGKLAVEAAELSSKIRPQRFVFMEEMETGVASYGEQCAISDEIYLLVEKRIFTPLTLFTNSALRYLGENAMSMKKKTMTMSGKADLIDPNFFGPEEDLTVVLFLEAWKNYRVFLHVVCMEPVLTRWLAHGDAMAGIPDLERNFKAVARHDREQRVSYHTQPFKFDELIYWRRFDQIKAEVEHEKTRSDFEAYMRSTLSTTPLSRERKQSAPARYQPYSADADTRRVDTAKKPFREGRPALPPGGTCLICGSAGHIARDCIAKTGPRGRPVFAKWDNGRRMLTAVKGDDDFCVFFNLKGPDGCRGDHPPRARHACSLCGGNHHATSGSCYA
ncbi:hypothetical protein PLICRDRAFT_30547 [Plicaturopsis crispa FD-325 SS-3]|nr:hypothetical protein PLICRDRAFT_30547 [Plicaturopsis crispa FD-325 SS-3]